MKEWCYQCSHESLQPSEKGSQAAAKTRMNTCYIIIPLSFCRHEPEKAVKPGVKFEEVYWENVSMQLIQMK